MPSVRSTLVAPILPLPARRMSTPPAARATRKPDRDRADQVGGDEPEHAHGQRSRSWTRSRGFGLEEEPVEVVGARDHGEAERHPEGERAETRWKSARSCETPFSRISMVMATYWDTVLALPSDEAGTTDAHGQRDAAQAGHRQLAADDHHRDPRARSCRSCTSETSAAATSSLSATGSSSVPSVVTWFRRRAMPPVEPVGERGGHEDDGGDEHADPRTDEMRKTMMSGTSDDPEQGQRDREVHARDSDADRRGRGRAPGERTPPATNTGTIRLTSERRHAARSAARPGRCELARPAASPARGGRAVLAVVPAEAAARPGASLG